MGEQPLLLSVPESNRSTTQKVRALYRQLSRANIALKMRELAVKRLKRKIETGWRLPQCEVDHLHEQLRERRRRVEHTRQGIAELEKEILGSGAGGY